MNNVEDVDGLTTNPHVSPSLTYCGLWVVPLGCAGLYRRVVVICGYVCIDVVIYTVNLFCIY